MKKLLFIFILFLAIPAYANIDGGLNIGGGEPTIGFKTATTDLVRPRIVIVSKLDDFGDGSIGITTGAGGSGTPGGSDGQVQYNNSGSFGADSGFTTNKAGSITLTGTATADVVDTQFLDNSSGSKLDIRDNVDIAGTLTTDDIHIGQGTFDLSAQYDVDPDLWLFDLHADRYPNGILITSITLDCTVADPTTEITGNLNYCDAVANGAFPGSNATLISAVNSTTGNYSSGAITTTVPTGKTVYLTLSSDPTDTLTDWHLRIHYKIL